MAKFWNPTGCGSTEKHVRVWFFEMATAHEHMGVRSTRPGQSGWLKDTKDGDSYTRDLDAGASAGWKETGNTTATGS